MIYLIINNKRHEIKTMTFPAGEVSVRVPDADAGSVVTIHALIQSSDDVMRLLLAADAVERNIVPDELNLVMPYIPFARQDRVCNKGESFSLAVFANLLKTVNFDSITVWDSHSHVALDHLAPVTEVSQADSVAMLYSRDKLFASIVRHSKIIAPDNGASKKIASVCKAIGHDGYIQASKVRDPLTGWITETIIHERNVSGNYLIIDDICDGGATFINLAKTLKENGAEKVCLYVTHGIFSKGIDHLKQNGIDEVFTQFNWTKEEC